MRWVGQCDGGWGTHIECASTMFGTVLSYISLRLLGLPSEHEACSRGRKFIRDNGGGVMAPSWAKFWMALLGVYEWEVSLVWTDGSFESFLMAHCGITSATE